MGLAPRLVRTANDGLVIGAFIGLGFAAFEDFLYAANSTGTAFGTDPVGNAVHMSFTRIAVSFVSHPLFSALVCCGVIYLLGTAAQPRRIGRGIALILPGCSSTSPGTTPSAWAAAVRRSFRVMLLSTVLGFTVLSHRLPAAAPREHQFVRDILAPEVEAGTLTSRRVDGVLDKKARKAFKKSAPNHGPTGAQAPAPSNPRPHPRRRATRAPTPRPSSTPAPRSRVYGSEPTSNTHAETSQRRMYYHFANMLHFQGTGSGADR